MDLIKLEENDISISCCAVNWKRIPKINPEEISNISMADKLASLEAKFALHDSALSDIRGENAVIENRVATIERNNNVTNKQWPQIITNNIKSPGSKASRDPEDALQSPSSVNGRSPIRRDYLRHARSTSRSRGARPTSRGSGRGRGGFQYSRARDSQQRPARDLYHSLRDSQHGAHDPLQGQLRDNEFDRARNEERGRTRDSRNPRAQRYPRSNESNEHNRHTKYGGGRRNGFMGQASSGGIRGGELPVRDFFIPRVHKDDGVEQLRDFLTSKGIETPDVVLSSIGDAKFNSFKLSVSVDDAEKVMDPLMWGRGVRVQRWRKYEQ